MSDILFPLCRLFVILFFQEDVIHRNLKLDNILLDAAGHVVLTDFGSSKEFPPDVKVNLISVLSVGESVDSNT
jgi:serine/threonine protein kinase